MNEREYLNAVLDEIRTEIQALDRFELRGNKTPLVNVEKE